MRSMIRIVSIIVLSLYFTSMVYAHVTVTPKKAETGYTVATVRVPNERDIPTTSVRVIVPEGVDIHGVMPISGWSHAEKRAEKMKDASDSRAESTSEGDSHSEEDITEITWSGGMIKAGEFMEFPISVKYPADVEKVTWRAYQTYSSGEVVPWDGSSEKYPASVVMIAKPGSEDEKNVVTKADSGNKNSKRDWLSVVAIILSVGSLGLHFRKK